MSEKRKPDAWMPLYIGDYLRDTSRLTRDQHGGYLLLIFDYWVNGPLPDDDEQLAAVTKSTRAEWRKLRPVLERFFQIGDGAWRHKRIDQELANTVRLNEQRRNAGAASAEARRQRALNENPTGVETDLFTDEQRNARPSPSPSPSSSLRSEEKSLAQNEFPPWYEIYPRHVGRGAAVKAFVAARKLASLEQLIDGARRYAATCGTDEKYIAYPATWLNQQRWLDEPAKPNGRAANRISEPRRPDAPAPVYRDGKLVPRETEH